jgi:SAM-dependent methyltransferase
MPESEGSTVNTEAAAGPTSSGADIAACSRMGDRVKDSRFWNDLWDAYSHVPSVALCRVPELEYASTLDVACRVLDHCCGDGLFSTMAWPGRTLAAGCDIDARAVEKAGKLGHYQSLESCDASRRLPFEDSSFDLVFNNSGLEHIADLNAALAQVARVLRPSGTFAFSVLNARYFEWWPLSDEARECYREIQPFHHALPLSVWTEHLESAGFRLVTAQGYFDRKAAQQLARLDYSFSQFHISGQNSVVVRMHQAAPRLTGAYWRRKLGSLVWSVPADAAAGYFIKAIRNDE